MSIHTTFTPLSPSLFTPHQIIYSAPLIPPSICRVRLRYLKTMTNAWQLSRLHIFASYWCSVQVCKWFACSCSTNHYNYALVAHTIYPSDAVLWHLIVLHAPILFFSWDSVVLCRKLFSRYVSLAIHLCVYLCSLLSHTALLSSFKMIPAYIPPSIVTDVESAQAISYSTMTFSLPHDPSLGHTTLTFLEIWSMKSQTSCPFPYNSGLCNNYLKLDNT